MGQVCGGGEEQTRGLSLDWWGEPKARLRSGDATLRSIKSNKKKKRPARAKTMARKNLPNISSELRSCKAEIEPPPWDERAQKPKPPSSGLTITNITDDLIG